MINPNERVVIRKYFGKWHVSAPVGETYLALEAPTWRQAIELAEICLTGQCVGAIRLAAFWKGLNSIEVLR